MEHIKKTHKGFLRPEIRRSKKEETVHWRIQVLKKSEFSGIVSSLRVKG